MIPSSSCPPWLPDDTGQSCRSARYCRRSYTTRRDTISFFARLQDKFTYAITGQESAEILLERADHTLRNMGLQTMKSDRPSAGDAIIAKNYLDGDELYALHILCEQFLLFVESRSLRGHDLTMAEMSAKFDELIKVQGHPIFTNYRAFIAQRAKNHALNELTLYRDRVLLERNRRTPQIN